jgi:hypothetical protein
MAIACDGSRVHSVNSSPLEDGFYAVHKSNKSIILIEKTHELDAKYVDFPDCTDRLVLPEDEVMEADFTTENVSGAYTTVIRTMSKSTLHFKFVADICESFDSVADFIVPAPENGETCKPVHFIKNEYHAVVMPIHLPKQGD